MRPPSSAHERDDMTPVAHPADQPGGVPSAAGRSASLTAGYQAPECLCSHMLAEHRGGQACAVDGCGCRTFRDRGDGPTKPVPDTSDPKRPF